MTTNADHSSINLARLLTDGEHINIMSLSELKDNSKININTASIEELMQLRGIGEKKAKDILKYKKENGNFKSIDDLKKVRGFKDAFFDKIKDKIIAE